MYVVSVEGGDVSCFKYTLTQRHTLAFTFTLPFTITLDTECEMLLLIFRSLSLLRWYNFTGTTLSRANLSLSLRVSARYCNHFSFHLLLWRFNLWEKERERHKFTSDLRSCHRCRSSVSRKCSAQTVLWENSVICLLCRLERAGTIHEASRPWADRRRRECEPAEGEREWEEKEK